MKEKRNYKRVLVGNAGGERSRRRYEDYLKKIDVE